MAKKQSDQKYPGTCVSGTRPNPNNNHLKKPKNPPKKAVVFLRRCINYLTAFPLVPHTARVLQRKRMAENGQYRRRRL